MTSAPIHPAPAALAERVAHQRDVKANACRLNARAHGEASHWGRVYLAEAAQWEEAARAARRGDLTPFALTPVTFGDDLERAAIGPVSAASLHPVPADLSPYEADGADARAHGYALDRNPYVWTPDRGEELAGHKAKREAWARGWNGGRPRVTASPWAFGEVIEYSNGQTAVVMFADGEKAVLYSSIESAPFLAAHGSPDEWVIVTDDESGCETYADALAALA